MDETESGFPDYCRRLWREHLRHAAPWARDNILWSGLTVLVIPPLLAFFFLRRHIDWPLLWTTLLFYSIAFLVYGAVQFVRAAWKSDLALREKIAKAALAFGEMVKAKDKERETIERTLRAYEVIWTSLQLRARELAIDLREYAKRTGTDPTPPLIAGEGESDFLERRLKLMQPWMETVTSGYDKNFAARVQDLRDEFATLGYTDSKLDYRLNTAVVHTDQVREIADRLMGLALRELAKRQLGTLTLEQLCSD